VSFAIHHDSETGAGNHSGSRSHERRPTVSFLTLGCKLNQSETAILEREFESRGYDTVGWEFASDVSVVHTCAVTGRSAAKCRQAVHHRLNRHPATTMIVAGCYSQTSPDEIARIPGVDWVFGTEDKFRLFDVFRLGKRREPCICVSNPTGKDREFRSGRFNTTRAFLKIQSGCSHSCSYCIVPIARGPSRSLPAESILREAEYLVRNGYKEIVLTGIHAGDYGGDIGSSFPELLRNLVSLGLDCRFRLTSIDPEDVTDAFLDAVSDTRVCPHFHLPVQSASDKILKRMRRRTDRRGLELAVRRIGQRFPEAGLGADVIAGFPGETDEDFERTFDFIACQPFTYLHAFPFSARPGTDAAGFTDPVHPKTISERVARLRELGRTKKERFAKQWIGRIVSVLFERQKPDGIISGFSREYMRVETPNRNGLENSVRSVLIERIERGVVMGSLSGQAD
jgi:threonylcarbamoyladenosine tRNA methylthiotransferase MtaB